MLDPKAAAERVQFDSDATDADFEWAVSNALKYQGWSFSPLDHSVWKKSFPDRYKMCCARVDGEMVGFCFISVQPRLPHNLTHFGCFMVLPELRGSGIGKRLHDWAVADGVAHGDNLTLVAAMNMTPKYAKYSGYDKYYDFVYKCSWFDPRDVVDLDDIQLDGGFTVRDYAHTDDELVARYDREITGVDRSHWVKAMCEREDGKSKVALDRSGRVTGYCAIREVVDHRLLVCPLFANDSETAARLLGATLRAFGQQRLATIKKVLYGCPSTHTEIDRSIAQLCGGKPPTWDKDNTRQFVKETVPVDIQRVFCLSIYGLSMI